MNGDISATVSVCDDGMIFVDLTIVGHGGPLLYLHSKHLVDPAEIGLINLEKIAHAVASVALADQSTSPAEESPPDGTCDDKQGDAKL